MLRIRDAQLAALTDDWRDRHRWDLLTSIRRNDAELLAGRSDEELRTALRVICDRAEVHGVSVASDLLRYVTVGLWWGAAFDTDPALPWARAILADEEVTSVSERVLNLHACSARLVRKRGS